MRRSDDRRWIPVTAPFGRPRESSASDTAHESSPLSRAIRSSKRSLPVHERHRVPRSRFGAIARNIVDLVIAPALSIHRRAHGNPVLDLGGADLEHVLREAGQALLVATLHGGEHGLIQLLVDDEMTQPAGSHHRDTAGALEAANRALQRAAQFEAPADLRLIVWIMHVQADR